MISKNYKFAWLLLVLPRYCAFVFPTASSPAIRCPTKIAFDPATSFDLDHVVALSHINAPSFVVSDVDQAKGASYFFSKFLDKGNLLPTGLCSSLSSFTLTQRNPCRNNNILHNLPVPLRRARCCLDELQHQVVQGAIDSRRYFYPGFPH